MKSKTRYFTSSLAVAASGISATSAEVLITPQPQNMTITQAGGGTISFDITGDAVMDYRFVYANNNRIKPQITSQPFDGTAAALSRQIMFPSVPVGTTVTKTLPVLASGATIDGSLFGGNSLNEAFFYQNYDANYYGAWGGGAGGASPPNPAVGPVDGYIALRIGSAGSWNYGYAHVTLDVPNGSMTLIETGYQTVVNTPITIGIQDPKLSAPATFSASSSAGPVTVQVPVSNVGTTNTLSLSSASFEGPDADYFSVAAGQIGKQIAPGQSNTFNVNFDSLGAEGQFSATLVLGSNDPYVPSRRVLLKVDLAVPKIVVASTLTLGPVANSAPVQNYNLAIKNDGTGELQVYSASFSGPYGPRFQPLNNDFITIPAGGATANLPFSFDPTGLAAGGKSAVLTLQTNVPPSYMTTVPVTVQVTAPAQESTVSLVHRWSFTDLKDSVGHADATLVGAAAVTGGKLVLPGVGVRQDYAEVPISNTITAASSLTFEAWITPANPAQWTKVWMFGEPGVDAATSTYLDFTLKTDTAGYPSASFRSGAEITTRGGTNPPAIPSGSEAHVVAVYDDTADLISFYVNGALVDTVAWTGKINDLGVTTQNYLGAPVFFGDPDFSGSINEMRIWRGALDPADVAASYSAGTEVLINPNAISPNDQPMRITGVQITGGNIVITGGSGLVAGQTYHLQTSTTLADFTPVPGSTFTGGQPIPTVPANGPKRFVRIATGPSGN